MEINSITVDAWTSKNAKNKKIKNGKNRFLKNERKIILKIQ
jgi:hypothetical protein